MRLLTHNMLKSHVKNVKNGFPLKIESENIVVNEVDFNAEFISRMIPKVEVQEGNLVCPESDRKFPVKNGIPNMLLNDDEV
ncbi:multifunctional methyltransferase subunit TRM112 homolog A-like [Exaiptasia diaphana]|uniref:Multifunctional methyltransferase subunit TRM112-like protein n=1 Tax=Exaiptasia diaphana TaxID=2652724 RepID=A0A913XWE7_EXADI|nr:multifunctional methyltransferase subunit TRM112 homolog A-like [Exaiptasia diaphana]